VTPLISSWDLFTACDLYVGAKRGYAVAVPNGGAVIVVDQKGRAIVVHWYTGSGTHWTARFWMNSSLIQSDFSVPFTFASSMWLAQYPVPLPVRDRETSQKTPCWMNAAHSGSCSARASVQLLPRDCRCEGWEGSVCIPLIYLDRRILLESWCLRPAVSDQKLAETSHHSYLVCPCIYVRDSS
jgi:hypothetical protein